MFTTDMMSDRPRLHPRLPPHPTTWRHPLSPSSPRSPSRRLLSNGEVLQSPSPIAPLWDFTSDHPLPGMAPSSHHRGVRRRTNPCPPATVNVTPEAVPPPGRRTPGGTRPVLDRGTNDVRTPEREYEYTTGKEEISSSSSSVGRMCIRLPRSTSLRIQRHACEKPM